MRRTIEVDSVDVWWASTSTSTGINDSYLAALSSDELERAEHFVFLRDQQRFALSRIMLRHILAGYLACSPVDIAFEYGAHGKPRLRAGRSRVALEFNLAHSHELVVCAVANGQRVGIDVEYIQPLVDMERITATAFSHTEQNWLFTLAPEHRLTGFYHCWTRKEAYVKARGDGLFMDFKAFDVPLARGESAAFFGNWLKPHEVGCWSFYELDLACGYVGALVVQGGGVTVHMRHWDWVEPA